MKKIINILLVAILLLNLVAQAETEPFCCTEENENLKISPSWSFIREEELIGAKAINSKQFVKNLFECEEKIFKNISKSQLCNVEIPTIKNKKNQKLSEDAPNRGGVSNE